MGLPRPPRRVRDRPEAQHHPPRSGPRDGRRQVQRHLPRHRHAVHQGVGEDRHATRTVGRLRERLQDDGPHVHGERVVGVQGAVSEGSGVPGVQGHALQHRVRDAVEQLRGGVELQGRSRSGRGGELPDEGRRGRELRGVDDDSLDSAQQHRAVRSSRHGIRQDPRQEGRKAVRTRQVSSGPIVPHHEQQEEVEAQDGRRFVRHRGDLPWKRPRRQEVPARLRLLRLRRGVRGVLSHPLGQVRHRRRRNGHRPPGARLRRGRLPRVPRARRHQEGAGPPVSRRLQRTLHRRRPRGEGAARQEGRRHAHQTHQGERPVGQQGQPRSQLSLLLAQRHAPHLQGGAVLVHQGGRHSR
mmetsp:Transcript_26329/g.54992  ORF Transcript_26329/g.54992 Transcript_26329/m.54992 type:complete len:354 (+) Transcript_26329:427-1488(+)